MAKKPKKAPKKAPKKKPRKAPSSAGRSRFDRTLEGKLVRALEHAQDLAIRAGYVTRLETRRPIGAGYDASDDKTPYGKRAPSGQFAWKSPWAIIAEFTLRRPIGYGDLYRLLSSWDRASLSRRVDGKRIGRIRVVYSDGGATDEYSLSETFSWDFALARSRYECNPMIHGSLAQRYKDSRVVKVIVWLSHEVRGMKKAT